MSKNAPKKAWLIDSKTRTISPIEITDNASIYAAIGNGCRHFACPVEFDNSDTLYTDDEGLYNEFDGGYKFPGWSYPIVGNAIILGCNPEDGDSRDVQTPKEVFEAQIEWLSKEQAEAWAANFI